MQLRVNISSLNSTLLFLFVSFWFAFFGYPCSSVKVVGCAYLFIALIVQFIISPIVLMYVFLLEVSTGAVISRQSSK